ncbi:MAG TPA: hypothetical protein VGD67_00560 [Pseudonocardiaceae bacterium]
MVAVVAVELLDGTWLGVDVRGADRAVDAELRTWALVPNRQENPRSRSEASWDDVLDCGPLLTALRQRVLPSAAWRVFPSTARHLTARWGTQAGPLDAAEVSARVRQAVGAAAVDRPVAAAPECTLPHQLEDGSWLVHVDGTVEATCARDGSFVVMRRCHDQPSATAARAAR